MRLPVQCSAATGFLPEQKTTLRKRRVANPNGERQLSFGYFAATQAAGANPHALVAGLGLGVDGTQVDIPPPPPDVVRVADVVTKLRAFAADFTNLCHE